MENKIIYQLHSHHLLLVNLMMKIQKILYHLEVSFKKLQKKAVNLQV